MDFGLRRIILAIGLLFAVCGGNAAYASCTGTGSLTVTVTTCPVKQVLRHGSAGYSNFSVKANSTYPKAFYVVLSGDTEVVSKNSLSAYVYSSTSMGFSYNTPASLAAGKHTGTLTMRLCTTASCSSVYTTAAIPYEYDVDVPPSITQMSPKSVTVGAGAFTLKLIGHFTSDCKIHFAGKALTTKFVSASELTATENLSSATHGTTYSVTVVPSNGLVSNTATFTLDNPVPTVSVLAPAAATVGAAPFTMTVTGAGFVSKSMVMLGTMPLTTTHVSRKVLTAQVDISHVTAGANYAVSVVSPTPGGGTSQSANFTLNAQVPVLTSLSPNSTTVPTVGCQFWVYGSGFQPNSVVRWNGTPVETAYDAPNALLAWCPAMQSGMVASVDVMTPSPGGGASNALAFTGAELAPQLSWIAPTHLYTTDGDQVVSAVGTHFDADTKIYWNGTPLTTVLNSNYAGRYYLQAKLPANQIGPAGLAIVVVTTPAPGGGTAEQAVAVTVHPPVIDSLSPDAVAPGGSDLPVTVYGSYFDPSAVVSWNDQHTLTPDSVSATTLHFTVPLAYVADPGVSRLTVENPVAAGGNSLPASLTVDASGTSVRMLSQSVNDLDWDSTRSVFYGSVPSSDSNYPHAIVTIDPITASVTASKEMTTEPGALAVAPDGSYLYVAFNNDIQRLDLPLLSLDLDFTSFGQAKNMAVSPEFPHVVAANIQPIGMSFTQTTVWMDNSGMPPGALASMPGMAWSPDGADLWGGSATGTFFDTTVFVWGWGDSFDTTNLWSGTRMHLDAGSGLIYADNSTAVIDPVAKKSVATFPVSGVMVPDSSLGCAYFITQTAAQVTAGANDYTLSCYSTTDQTLTRSLVIPAVVGTPTKMMRWGNEGLAFITDGGYIYFVSGQIVTGN